MEAGRVSMSSWSQRTPWREDDVGCHHGLSARLLGMCGHMGWMPLSCEDGELILMNVVNVNLRYFCNSVNIQCAFLAVKQYPVFLQIS